MDHETNRAREVFLALLDVEATARREKLAELCGDDAELRREVETLLTAHGDSAGFLEAPLLPRSSPAMDRGPALAPGDQIGPYRLREVLGEGGMGVVFLADQQEALSRQVALKVIKPGMDSRRVIARFEAERQALAMMEHPGIARVHDAGTTESGYPYFVMEYVDGQPLHEYCDRHRLSIARRIEFFLEVCEAIRHAHQRGVLHRDLKPTNLLVCEEGGVPCAKVIDFGVAKAMGGADDEERLTISGTVVGTPEYMSPEQADAAENAIDTRSDTYSLGVVLYELLTGVLPIPLHDTTREGISAVRKRIAEEIPETASRRALTADGAQRRAENRGVSVDALASQLRGDLEWILRKALEKNPEDRYATVHEFAADLRRHLANEPVLAYPPTGAYRLRKFVARNRGPVLASGAVLLALVLGLVASLAALLRAWKAEEEFFLVAVEIRLDEAVRDAETLPAASPRDAEELQRVARELESLLGHLPQLRAQRDELRTRGETEDAEMWRFEDPNDQWWHQNLSRVVGRLEDLASEEAPRSALVRLHERCIGARDADRISIEEHAEEWREAIAAIAVHPAYEGLELSPQTGLVPLEPDPASELWEFWHPRSGERPRRGLDGMWEIEEGTGVVYVLIPAGEFLMGARPPREGEEPGIGNLDSWAQGSESPVHTVSIGRSYFLSKYEMTQGQWLRLDFVNPSQGREETSEGPGRLVFGPRHPVESVSWARADRLLRRMGWTLPTEAQWEYAARAGVEGPYLCGPDPAGLEEFANVCDQSAMGTNLRLSFEKIAVPWNDGWGMHAPVGTFAANDFGLHDVQGNVWEWVLEPMGDYRNPVDPEDGRRILDMPHEMALARGGSCFWGPPEARLSWRNTTYRELGNQETGVRPARKIEP